MKPRRLAYVNSQIPLFHLHIQNEGILVQDGNPTKDPFLPEPPTKLVVESSEEASTTMPGWSSKAGHGRECS